MSAPMKRSILVGVHWQWPWTGMHWPRLVSPRLLETPLFTIRAVCKSVCMGARNSLNLLANAKADVGCISSGWRLRNETRWGSGGQGRTKLFLLVFSFVGSAVMTWMVSTILRSRDIKELPRFMIDEVSAAVVLLRKLEFLATRIRGKDKRWGKSDEWQWEFIVGKFKVYDGWLRLLSLIVLKKKLDWHRESTQ